MCKQSLSSKVVNSDKCTVGDDEKPEFFWFVDGKEYIHKQNKTSFGWGTDLQKADMNKPGVFEVKVVMRFLGEEHQDSVEIQILPNPDSLKFSAGQFQTIELGKNLTFEIEQEGDSQIEAKINNFPFETVFGGVFDSHRVFNSLDLIDSELLIIDTEYTLKLCKNSTICDSQVFSIKQGKQPLVEIRCVENCQELYNPNRRGKFVVECSNCEEDEIVSKTVLSKTGDLTNAGVVVFEENFFKPEDEVSIIGEIELTNGNIAKNAISITVNTPPFNGTCGVSSKNETYAEVSVQSLPEILLQGYANATYCGEDCDKKKDCTGFQMSTINSAEVCTQFSNLTAPGDSEKIMVKISGFGKTMSGVSFSCVNWEGSTALTFAVSTVSVKTGKKVSLGSQSKTDVFTAKLPNSNEKTMDLDFKVCDQYLTCSTTSTIIALEQASSEEILEVANDLAASINPMMSTDEAMSAAMLADESGALDQGNKELLAKNVANVIESLEIDEIDANAVQQISGVMSNVAENMKSNDQQRKVTDKLTGFSDALGGLELSQTESNDVVGNLANAGTSILKNNIPESKSTEDFLSGKGVGVYEADKRNLTPEELRYEMMTNRYNERKNSKDKKNNTLEMSEKVNNLGKSLGKQMKKTTTEGDSTQIEAAGVSLAASTGVKDPEANGTFSIGSSGSGIKGNLTSKPIQVQMDKAIISLPNDDRAKTIKQQMRIETADTEGGEIDVSMADPISKSARRKRSVVIPGTHHARRKRDLASMGNSGIPDQMNSSVFTGDMSVSSFKLTTKGSGIVVVAEPIDNYKEVMLDVYLSVGKAPTIEMYDFHFKLPHDLEIWNMDEAYDNWKIFLDTETVKINSPKLYGLPDDISMSMDGGDTWYVGIIQSQPDFDVRFDAITPSCRTQDPDTYEWSGEGCILGERTSLDFTQCKCVSRTDGKPLILGTEMFAPPNTINFATVFSDFDISDNPSVIATMCCFFAVWILFTCWCTVRWDREDTHKWRVRQLIDNSRYPMDKSVLYQVTISTGHVPNAGTKSRVCLQIKSGDRKVRTKPRALKTRKGWMEFERGSVTTFIVRDVDFGLIDHLRIWHDNSGTGWNVDTVILKRLDNGNTHFFMVRDWLAVDKGSGAILQTIPESTPDDNQEDFSSMFKTSIWSKLSEDHLWVSVFYRTFKCSFNRTQRWAVCFMLVFITFVANCMWFETGQPGPPIISVGPVEMSGAQIWASVCAALVSVPPVVILVFLFKRTRSVEEENYESSKTKLAQVVPETESVKSLPLIQGGSQNKQKVQ